MNKYATYTKTGKAARDIEQFHSFSSFVSLLYQFFLSLTNSCLEWNLNLYNTVYKQAFLHSHPVHPKPVQT